MPKTNRAITSVLNNKVRDVVGGIGNPRVRDAAGRLLNAKFPGFGGRN